VIRGVFAAIGFDNDSRETLRRLIEAEYSCRDLVLLDSGTTALTLAMRGASLLSDSDVVAIPNFCCFDIATALVGADCRAALYDIRPDSLGPDFESLREALEAGARTVVVAHLFGLPIDLDKTRELCSQFEALLIEDAAQAVGGKWDGRVLGSLGSLGILSFGRGKGRTGGGGGALLANDRMGEAALTLVRDSSVAGGRGLGTMVRLLGQFLFGRPPQFALAARVPQLNLGETVYKDPWPARGIDRAAAAALVSNWAESSRAARLRATRAFGHTRRIGKDESLLIPRAPAKGVAGYLRYPVVLRGSAEHPLEMEPGVSPSYPTEIRRLPAMQDRIVYATEGDGARLLAQRLRTVPTHKWARKGGSI
jgi:hypothetical protein